MKPKLVKAIKESKELSLENAMNNQLSHLEVLSKLPNIEITKAWLADPSRDKNKFSDIMINYRDTKTNFNLVRRVGIVTKSPRTYTVSISLSLADSFNKSYTKKDINKIETDVVDYLMSIRRKYFKSSEPQIWQAPDE